MIVVLIVIVISLHQLFMLIKDVVFTVVAIRLRKVRGHHDAANCRYYGAGCEYNQQKPEHFPSS